MSHEANIKQFEYEINAMQSHAPFMEVIAWLQDELDWEKHALTLFINPHTEQFSALNYSTLGLFALHNHNPKGPIAASFVLRSTKRKNLIGYPIEELVAFSYFVEENSREGLWIYSSASKAKALYVNIKGAELEPDLEYTTLKELFPVLFGPEGFFNSTNSAISH